MASNNSKQQHYQQFTRCYRGRDDVVAQQQRDGSFLTRTGGLTYQRFIRHLNLSSTYCIYNLDKAGKVGFIMYDMDVFPRPRQPGQELLPKLRAKKEQVLALLGGLEALGVEPDQVLVEFPTVGYHVVLPLATPLPVRQAKAFARLARDRAGLRYETPFYPDAVWGYGDMVRLPLRLNENTGHRSNFIRDIRTFDPTSYDPAPDFSALERLRPVSAQTVLTALEKATSRTYRPVAQAEEVPPGSTKLVEYQGERVLVVNDGGRLFAVAEACPHAGAPLSLMPLRDGLLTCPWHGSRFRVATGEVLNGPCRTGLVHHAVRLTGGQIWVGPLQP